MSQIIILMTIIVHKEWMLLSLAVLEDLPEWTFLFHLPCGQPVLLFLSLLLRLTSCLAEFLSLLAVVSNHLWHALHILFNGLFSVVKKALARWKQNSLIRKCLNECFCAARIMRTASLLRVPPIAQLVALAGNRLLLEVRTRLTAPLSPSLCGST